MNKDNLPKIKNDICPKKDYSNLTTEFYYLDDEPFMLKEVETAIKDIAKKEDNAISDEIIRISASINTSFSLNRDKVIELVSKGVPKKITVKDEFLYYCPTCGADKFSLMYDYNINDRYNYCCNCGQKLDWSDIVND